MEKDKKLVFFDIDGTLIDDNGFISDSAVKAIHKVRESGNLCYINTGRPYSHIAPEIKAIGFDGFICGCGQHIIAGGEKIRFAGLSREFCQFIIDKIRACHLDAIYEGEAGFWVEFRDIPEFFIQEQKRFASYGLKTCLQGSADGAVFEKFICYVNSESRLDAFNRCMEPYFKPIDRGGGMYEYVQKGYSKQQGLQTVLENTGIPLENCYAFGDSTNDLPMLEYIPHSIAMGNAVDTVKRVVEYVTEDMYHDGIEKAIEHYRLDI